MKINPKLLSGEEFKKFLRVRNVCAKLGQVSKARPVKLTLEEVQVLTDYFEGLEEMIDAART